MPSEVPPSELCVLAVYELSLSLVNSRPDFTYDMYTTVNADQDLVDTYNEKYELEICQSKKEKVEVGDWFPVGITLGLAAVDQDHSKKAEREAEFPLALTDIGASFVCSAGQASVEEDRLRILETIGDDNTRLDEQVHSVVATAALSRALSEQNEQRRKTYLEAIRKCPPPELQLNLTGGKAGAQETVNAVIEALASRNECKMLELTTKHATSIPASIGNLTVLRTLNLGGDKYRKEGCSSLTSLPEAIGGLTALQTLNLRHCQSLASLPEAIGGLTALQTLNLSNCQSLTSLPEAIGGLTALQTLNLEYCYELASLPEAIGGLTVLQTLNLQYCLWLTSLPEAIGGLTALQTLNLANCNRLTSLPEAIGGLTALQTLNLRYCYELTSLPEAIGGLTTLRTVHTSSWFSDNATA